MKINGGYINFTELMVLTYLSNAIENATGEYNILPNTKYGAMAYDLFTPNTIFKTPDSDITLDEEEKKEAWKLALRYSKVLEKEWTKDKAIEWYKSALFCRLMSTAYFHGWDFVVIVPSTMEKRNENGVVIEFYERKYKQQVEELLK